MPAKPVPSGEVCRNCGNLMVRTGSCYTCPCCGDTTGCGRQAQRDALKRRLRGLAIMHGAPLPNRYHPA